MPGKAAPAVDLLQRKVTDAKDNIEHFGRFVIAYMVSAAAHPVMAANIRAINKNTAMNLFM